MEGISHFPPTSKNKTRTNKVLFMLTSTIPHQGDPLRVEHKEVQHDPQAPLSQVQQEHQDEGGQQAAQGQARQAVVEKKIWCLTACKLDVYLFITLYSR